MELMCLFQSCTTTEETITNLSLLWKTWLALENSHSHRRLTLSSHTWRSPTSLSLVRMSSYGKTYWRKELVHHLHSDLQSKLSMKFSHAIYCITRSQAKPFPLNYEFRETTQLTTVALKNTTWWVTKLKKCDQICPQSVRFYALENFDDTLI